MASTTRFWGSRRWKPRKNPCDNGLNGNADAYTIDITSFVTNEGEAVKRKYRRKPFSAVVIHKQTVFTGACCIILLLFLLLLSKSIRLNPPEVFLRHSLDASLPCVRAMEPEETAEQRKMQQQAMTDKTALFICGIDLSKPYTMLANAIPYFGQFIKDYPNLAFAKAEFNEQAAFNGPNADTAPTQEPQEQQRLPIEESQNPGADLKLKNETTYQVDTKALLDAPLSFQLQGGGPHVLIVHTHASESYSPTDQNFYLPSDPSRTEDTNFNVVRVGDELEQQLKQRGVSVIHARDINDYPSYNESYKKTLGVIEWYLQKYPSIQMVFDVHRDAVVKADGAKVKFTADIDGEKMAQVMLVCGTDQGGLQNDTWQENLKFALKLQNTLETKYPGLARPLNLRKERFNLHATPGSLIMEIGTHGNTLEEALAAMPYLAQVVADTIKPYQK